MWDWLQSRIVDDVSRGDLVNQVMDGIVGKSEKKRIAFIGMQEVDRFLGENLGQVGIMVTLRFEFLISTVSHQRTECSAVSLGVRRSFPYIFRQQEIVETMGGKPEKLIVPVIQRIGVDILPVQGFVPKIIFTNLCRLVPVFPENACQGGNALGQTAIKPTLRIPASLVPTGYPSGLINAQPLTHRLVCRESLEKQVH